MLEDGVNLSDISVDIKEVLEEDNSSIDSQRIILDQYAQQESYHEENVVLP